MDLAEGDGEVVDEIRQLEGQIAGLGPPRSIHGAIPHRLVHVKP
jgi:hypothetical protein